MPLTRVTTGVIEDLTILAEDIADDQVGIQQLNVSDGNDGDALTTDGAGNLSFTAISGPLFTTTALPPTVTEFPNNQDWGYHKDSNTGDLYLVYNDSGTIKGTILSAI